MMNASLGVNFSGSCSGASKTPLGRLLRRVFDSFDDKGVIYAILRNPDRLPDYTRNDVDLLVAPESLETVSHLILREAGQCGWQVLSTLNKFQYRCHWLVQGPLASVETLQIDLLAGLNYRRWPYARAGIGLSKRYRHRNGFWAVPPGFEAGIALVKELLARGFIREEIREGIKTQAAADPETFEGGLRGCLSPDLVGSLQRAAGAGRWAELATPLASQVKTQVVRPMHRGLLSLVPYSVATLRHYLRPPLSCFVVLIGPDGSGKTSVAEQLGSQLLNQPFKVVKRGKSNFGVLPPLNVIRNSLRRVFGHQPVRRMEAPVGTFHSGMIRPNPLPASLVYVAYYAFDAWLGRIILRRWRGQCGLIIFDRYYYDYYYQVGNRHAPRWYLRLLELLVPVPDLLVHLDRDPEEIFSKKPELSVAEISLQQRQICKLMVGRSGAHVVDAKQGLSSSVEQVQRLVTKHLVEGRTVARAGRVPAS